LFAKINNQQQIGILTFFFFKPDQGLVLQENISDLRNFLEKSENLKRTSFFQKSYPADVLATPTN
jgi:hypothetical protein